MALRVTWIDDAGASRGFSIQRVADGLRYDPADGAFKVSPAAPVMALAAGSGDFAGTYAATLADTPTTDWLEGDYLVTIHDTAAANAVVGAMGVVMHAADGGQSDDATVIPSGAGVAPPSVDAIAAHLLDAEMIGGGTLREAMEAMAAVLAGNLTQPADGTASTIRDFKAEATVRLTSVNGPTGRTVTILP
jgi:hypothetical protein